MTSADITIKEEPPGDKLTDEDEHMEEPQLGPAALGLQRVGAPVVPRPSPVQPPQVLNARGMPARIRKKNRLFFDDDIVNTPHHRSPPQNKTPRNQSKTNLLPRSKSNPVTNKTPTNRKVLLSTRSPSIKRSCPLPSPPLIDSPDRTIGQKIGLRLRNLLKLPKAHKWVCYEWFYSNIDKCLFDGDNDFMNWLRESYPELKSRELTRVEWTKIRRMMGRPRRCSQAFFDAERLDLEKKRKKIRALQQRKVADISNFKDLPPEVPMQLVIGTKVTARLRKPQDGLFTGSIDAVDTSNNTYRITFERQGLGTHSVPDYEVLSNDVPDTITMAHFNQKTGYHRSASGISSLTSPYFARNNGINLASNNFHPRHQMFGLSSSTFGSLSASTKPTSPLAFGTKVKLMEMPGGVKYVVKKVPDGNNNGSKTMTRLGGFPIKLLERMVLVGKILEVKRAKVKELSQMNASAEKYNSFDYELPEDFERKYASTLIDLERLNHDLQMYLDDMQVSCQEMALEPSVSAMLAPSLLRERCREDAGDIVNKYNNIILANREPTQQHQSVMELITDLTALMLQMKCLNDSQQHAYELQVLDGTLEQIKSKLSPGNRRMFCNHVEIHMKHIQMGLMQGVSLLDGVVSPPNGIGSSNKLVTTVNGVKRFI